MLRQNYNYGYELEDNFEDRLNDFFEYQWKNCYGHFLESEKDQMIFAQLPSMM